MTTTTTPPKFTIELTEEERAEMTRLLRQALGETRVEIHRTHTPEYRERVMDEQSLLRGLLEKIERSGT